MPVLELLLFLNVITWLAVIPLETWYIGWIVIPSRIISESRIHLVALLLGLQDCLLVFYIVYLIWGAWLAARSLWAGGSNGAPMVFALCVPVLIIDGLVIGILAYVSRVASVGFRGVGWAMLALSSAAFLAAVTIALSFVPRLRSWDIPRKNAELELPTSTNV